MMNRDVSTSNSKAIFTDAENFSITCSVQLSLFVNMASKLEVETSESNTVSWLRSREATLNNIRRESLKCAMIFFISYYFEQNLVLLFRYTADR